MARCKDGFGCTDVPFFIAWYQVQEEVTPLISEVEELIPGSFDFVDLHRLQISHHMFHQGRLPEVRAHQHVGREVTMRHL